jgi:hypothetical protein
MKRRLFTDQDLEPTDALLRRQLGSAIESYSSVIATSADFRRQWKYSRGNGWLLRVGDSNKALYYLIAFDEGIEISLALREEERADFLLDSQFEVLQPQLKSAQKFSEGYALRFEIESTATCELVCQFLSALVARRKLKGPKLRRSDIPMKRTSEFKGKASNTIF